MPVLLGEIFLPHRMVYEISESGESLQQATCGHLFTLGAPAEVAQTILRHANVSTTREHYIVLKSKNAGAKAMRRLQKAVNVAQTGSRSSAGKRRNPHKHSTGPR